MVGLERLILVAADRELQDLRELLERAALDGELWRTVCDRLADFLGGVGTVFVPEDLAVQGPWLVASASLSELIAAAFRDEWHLRNYRRRAIPIIKRQGYATDLDIADAATMRREPFYAELLAPRKIGNFVGLNVAVGDQTWIASVQRASDAPPPDEALIARAKQALPALAAAARSSFMLGRKRFENWKDVIDEKSRGVFLVDHLGRLIDRNAASEIFLKDGDAASQPHFAFERSETGCGLSAHGRRRLLGSAHRSRRICRRRCFGRMRKGRCSSQIACV